MSELIYLDNAATTKVAPEVYEAMNPYFEEYYGNAASVYRFAGESKKAVEDARKEVADFLGAKPNEIYFTGGGSESDNWALKGIAFSQRKKGKHIITSAIEHHAILHTCEYLEKLGYEITYVGVDENGIIKLDELEKSIREDTILISVMFANNEIGSIQPIKEIGEIAKKHKVLFHTDAVQAYGHVPINVDECHIDMLSASGHKINGPKGIGFLYIRKGVKIRSFVHGGAQERKRRAGTENVPGIAGLGVAAELFCKNRSTYVEQMYACKKHLIEGLEVLEDVTVNGVSGLPLEETAPHIVSASFAGVRSEVLLHALAEKGVFVSSGSACSSNHPELSGTLKAIGVADELLDSTLRFSFSTDTTIEQIDYALEQLYNLLPMLRRFIRK